MDFNKFRHFISDSGEKKTFENALRLAINHLGGDEGSLLFPVNDQQELEFVMCCTKYGVNEKIIGQKLGVTEGLAGLAAQTSESQIGAPIYKDIEQKVIQGQSNDHPQSVLASPLLYQDKLIGVMTVVTFDSNKRFTMEDVQYYESMASLLALLLHKQRIIHELMRGTAAEEVDSDEGRVLSLVGDIVAQSPENLRAVIGILKGIKELK